MKHIILSALCLACAVAAMAQSVPVPSFDQWRINPTPEGYAGEGEILPPDAGYPQGRIVAKGIAGAKQYVVSASCEVDVKPGQEYTLTAEMEGTAEANADSVPAFRGTVKTSAGAVEIVNDGGLPKGAPGCCTSRSFVYAAERTALSADGRLTLCFYVMKLTGGSFTLTGVSLKPVPKADADSHEPGELPGGKGGIVFNEDCTEFFATRPDKDMTVEGLKRYMDRYLPSGHQVRIVMLNPGAHNNNFGAASCPVMWEGVDFDDRDDVAFDRFGNVCAPETVRMWKHMKSFVDSGINVYHVWIDHLRQRGVSPWISLRMNDAHDALTPDEERTDHRKNPDYRIAAYNPGDWHDQGSDYEKPEVRQLYLNIMDDYMETFDADGFEVDWMRFGRLFKHGREIVCAPLLTGMMRHFRAKADEMAARRGHPIKIAVRVPPRPDTARRLGYDVRAWADEHLFDMIVPSDFLWCTDADCPVADWRRIVGDGVLIAPCVERSVNPYVNTGYQGDAAIRRGFAAGWFHRGADMIYLFNHMSMAPDMNNGIMRTAGSPVTAESGSRRHPLTFPDFPYIGAARITDLPATVQPKATRAFRLPTGAPPLPGRRAWVVAGFSDTEAPVVQCRLDSALLPLAKRLPPVELGDFVKLPRAWNIPDGALLPDENVIEFTNISDKPATILWLEVFIEEAK